MNKIKNISKSIQIFKTSNLIKQTSVKSKIRIKNKFNNILVNGSGAFVIKRLVPPSIVEKTNILIMDIIQKQIKPENDHFSNNQRIWNFYEKFCAQNPKLFINYFRNPIFNLVIQSYLGPKYEISSQVNIVEPDSKSQIFHRDYHLGLMDIDEIIKYPDNIHKSSSNLTLQCLIAHTQITKENGATKFVPFSQKITNGYIDIHRHHTIKKCNENFIQLEMQPGDALFFNPALFHAAGNNNSKYNRIANILQINSAFSKSMESVNYNLLQKLVKNELKNIHLNKNEFDNIYEIIFNKYNYPRNLDKA